MKLNEIKDNKGARTKLFRVGRGVGSGKGETAGSGSKGQKSRSGVAINGFEGGQMPIYRRLPIRGFNNIFARELVSLNLGQIQAAIEAKRLDGSKTINAEAVKAAGLVKTTLDGLKILAKGEIKTKVTIEAVAFSEKAKAMVEKAGGKCETLTMASEHQQRKALHAERGWKLKEYKAKAPKK
jgi:large subunit ribosomal protein L15